MPQSSHAEKWLAYALLYTERFGLSVIPMSRDKRPLVKWLEYQDRRPTVKELLAWPKESLAIVTGAVSNLVVVDCESREDAQWFWKERGTSPVVVQTRRGYHLYFRHPGQPVKNGQRIEEKYDVRGDGGYVLAPPSLHRAGAYRWIRPMVATAGLPVFRPEWRPETRSAESYERVIHDGTAYIAKIRAVSGSGGHNDTYRAACALRAAGLRESEALVTLQAWNRTNAEPPWSDKDLLHKIREAFD